MNSTRDSLIVVASLYDVASGRRVDQAQQSAARAADPRPLYDALARDLLDLVGAPPVTLELARTTTSSVEAYRAYLDGVRALNSWQLARADSLFGQATRADSTFALAYYKHALTLGWMDPSDTAQLTLVARAGDYAGRLPTRERDIVSAYADLVRGLTSHFAADTARANASYLSAQRKYAAVVQRDSADAEAWYGLGDAYFHHVPDGFGPATVANHARSLRAFNRTLALDSTFHLAYSHKIAIYQEASAAGSPAVLSGDSVLYLATDSARRAFGAERVAEARRLARQLAIRDGRGWISADPVPQAYQALTKAYAEVGQFDSAATVLQEAIARPASRAPSMPYVLAAIQTRIDPAAALRTLRGALRDVGPDDLSGEGGFERFGSILAGANAATLAGSLDDLDAVVRVAVATEPTVPGIGMPTAPVAEWWANAARLAMGLPPAPMRRQIDQGIAGLDKMPAGLGGQIRQQSAAVPAVAYLATRDAKYLVVVRRWLGGGQPMPELDALDALAGGDSIRARAAAERFPSPDSVRAAGGNVSALRWIVRAEVFTTLGDARRALAMYEVLDPATFNTGGLIDPGWPLYARSFLARGRLYEQLGEREKAAQAYRRFLEIWKEADPALQPQLAEARERLARVQGGARAAGG